MTHILLALNAVALSVVVAMSLLPSKSAPGSLEYRTAMQAHPAVMGHKSADQAEQRSTAATIEQHLSF